MANRPFYRYGGHTELISFKEYYGMPRGHELDPIYSFGIYARFSENIANVFREYVCNGKKDRCVLFGGNNYRRVSQEIVCERTIPVLRRYVNSALAKSKGTWLLGRDY